MESGIQMELEPGIEVGSKREIHLLDLLIILSKRRRFILFFTAGIAILTVITVLLIPSKYTATTVILPPAQNSSMSSILLNQLGGAGALASMAGASLGIKNPGDMYVALFRSRTVEDALIQKFGLMARYHKKRMSDTRKAFEKRSEVSLGTKDGLITIEVTDTDPKLAADMANNYVNEFRKLTDGLAITEASRRRVFFQGQLLEANENLVTAEEAMKHMQQTSGVLQIDSQARSLIESAAALRGQVAAKEVQLQAMHSFATDDNPEVLVAEEQLSALKAQLAKLSGTAPNSNADIIVPKGNIPEAEMEYIRKLRDEKYYETIYELIAKQFEIAKLDEAREGAIVQVTDVAVPPDKHSSPLRTASVILATLLGFFVACVWCVVSAGITEMKNKPAERMRLDALRATFRKS